MYNFIIGKVSEISLLSVVVDTAMGVGYEINTTPHTSSISTIGETTKLYTKLSIKEDSHTLYGFYVKRERDLFCDLISVDGVGGKIALNLMSLKNYDEIVNAIGLGDEKGLVCKGIGAKTVMKIILDLKPKFQKQLTSTTPLINNENIEATIKALQSLGYRKTDIEKVKIEILEIDDTNTLIRKYLNALNK